MSTNENCYYFWMPSVSVRFRRVRRPAAGELLDMLARWIDRSAQRHRLAMLEDRMLKDIGISRADADRESGKWFWQD